MCCSLRSRSQAFGLRLVAGVSTNSIAPSYIVDSSIKWYSTLPPSFQYPLQLNIHPSPFHWSVAYFLIYYKWYFGETAFWHIVVSAIIFFSSVFYPIGFDFILFDFILSNFIFTPPRETWYVEVRSHHSWTICYMFWTICYMILNYLLRYWTICYMFWTIWYMLCYC